MTTQPYDPNIPTRNNTIGESQLDFLNNFAHLYNAFLVDHIALDAVIGAGNHNIIHLTEQLQQFQTNVGEISGYSKDVEGQTDQIFLKYQGTFPEFQYTTYQIYGLPQTSNQIPFFTFLPGNILVYFGLFTATLSFFDPVQLELNPPIAKNIITMNFCPAGVTSKYIPKVTLQKESTGIYQRINVFDSVSTTTTPTPTTLYYVVMANI